MNNKIIVEQTFFENESHEMRVLLEVSEAIHEKFKAPVYIQLLPHKRGVNYIVNIPSLRGYCSYVINKSFLSDSNVVNLLAYAVTREIDRSITRTLIPFKEYFSPTYFKNN
jgi:hypothetical protein